MIIGANLGRWPEVTACLALVAELASESPQQDRWSSALSTLLEGAFAQKLTQGGGAEQALRWLQELEERLGAEDVVPPLEAVRFQGLMAKQDFSAALELAERMSGWAEEAEDEDLIDLWSEQSEFASQALQWRASPSSQEAGQLTLLGAAAANDLELAREVLASGVAVSFLLRDWTPLLKAASKGHLRMVEFFLEAGADIHVRDSGGWTPVLLAVDRGHPEVVRYLVQRGARLDQKIKAGATVLQMAVNHGEPTMTRLLLELGVNSKEKINNGFTALHLAASGQGPLVGELLRLLASHIAVDTPGPGGVTALMVAVEEGGENVPVLLELGADPGRADEDGNTALEMAREADLDDVVQLFEAVAIPA